jgi:hypothetical protein
VPLSFAPGEAFQFDWSHETITLQGLPLADMMLPGVVVEMDAAEAESHGAFEETALSEADAWDANIDLVSDEAGHGN